MWSENTFPSFPTPTALTTSQIVLPSFCCQISWDYFISSLISEFKWIRYYEALHFHLLLFSTFIHKIQILQSLFTWRIINYYFSCCIPSSDIQKGQLQNDVAGMTIYVLLLVLSTVSVVGAIRCYSGSHLQIIECPSINCIKHALAFDTVLSSAFILTDKISTN